MTSYQLWLTTQLENRQPTLIGFINDEITHSGVQHLTQEYGYKQVIINPTISVFKQLEKRIQGPIIILGHGSHLGLSIPIAGQKNYSHLGDS